MRPADLLFLSLAALWQQKLRTGLTTLGVAFGALVLFVSLSLGIGVQETIVREARKYDELRGINVYPKWVADAGSQAAVVEIKGEMSDERRERLKEAIQTRSNIGVRGRQPPITVEHLVTLAGLEHVERVKPSIMVNGWVYYRGKAENTSIVAVHPAERSLQKKLLAGDGFTRGDSQEILISEYLLHRWGLTDDADLQRALGQRVRLEIRSRHEPQSGLRVHLSHGQARGPESREEAMLREKLVRALPEALAKVELTEPERALMEAWLKPKDQPSTPAKEVILEEEFTIAGVFRMPNKEDRGRPWDGLNHFVDVALPVDTAQRLYLKLAHQEEKPGFGSAAVVVAREDRLKQVQEQIEALGYNTHSYLEYVKRDQFLYKLIFAGMTCIAAVALLVAGLGITNTMLMSVLERTREVGIMKAVGAAEGHIQLIFLIEGALIGLVGGGLGVLLSWAASFPGDRWIRSMVAEEMEIKLEESLFVFPGWLLAGVVVFCGLVTTLAAVYPARRASRVNAVTALRHE